MNERKESKLKSHFKKHKVKYIVGGSIVTAGGLGYYVGRRCQLIGALKLSMDVNNHVAPTTTIMGKDNTVNNKTEITNNVSHIVNMGGRVKKLVKRVSDGRIFESVGEAAEAAGVDKSIMSKHINGHSNDIYGEKFTIVGLSAS